MNVRDGIVRAEKDGKLEFAGFQWWEPLTDRWQLLHNLLWCTGLPLILAVPFFLYVGDAFFNREYTVWGQIYPRRHEFGVSGTLLYLYTPAWSIGFALLYHLTRKHRSSVDLVRCVFVVEKEGGIIVCEEHDWFKDPQDWNTRQFSTLKYSYLDINSIEVVPTKSVDGGRYRFRDTLRYSVRLFFKDGNAYTLASTLEENDAGVVQTQLDAAWREACQAVAARKPNTVPDHLLRELAKVPERSRPPVTPARGTVTEEDF